MSPVESEPTTASMRERVLCAAAELTAESGWSSVTMAAIGDLIGVSRQTVYNEVGSKSALAEALVLREVSLFLTGVEAAFTAHPDSLYGGVHAAAVSILAQARTSALFGAVVSAEHGASNDLLPLFTTRSTALVELATSLVAEYVFHYDGIDRDDPTILPAIDTVVRIALSHVMQPGGSPDEVGHHIAWMVERLVEEAWRDIPARA